jgi:PAS domain S-box-containing protein
VSGIVRDTLADEPPFREVAESLGLGVPFRMYLSADGRTSQFLRVGAGCLAAIGVTAEALMADAGVLGDLVVPEDQARLMSDKAIAAGGRGPSSAELRLRKPGGELRWFRLTSARRQAEDGGSLLDGLIVDITDSKRLAEQLADERMRLEQAIELTGMGVFSWDRDDPETMLWSDDQYAICGVPSQTPITVNDFKDLVHPDDRTLGQTLIAEVLQAVDGGDFSLEHRIVRPDGEVRWVMLHQRVRRDAQGLKSIHGTTLDITDRRTAEEQRQLQMREISHRAKNALTVMMAMVQQAARSSETVAELAELILSRLMAMAKSQELAMTSGGAPVPLSVLVSQVLEVFDLSRFDIDPALEAVTLQGDTAVSLALLLHELATNAVKYGGLSNDAGRVVLSLQGRKEGWASVEWREVAGPPVAAPVRKGFGTRLLATALQSRGGLVTPSFAPEGFVARIEMPAV